MGRMGQKEEKGGGGGVEDIMEDLSGSYMTCCKAEDGDDCPLYNHCKAAQNSKRSPWHEV